MPCYDGISRQENEDARRMVGELRARLNEVTRMLCSLCDLSPVHRIDSVSGLREWLVQHRAFDARRAREEQRGKDGPN